MKKTYALLMLLLVLAGCGNINQYQKNGQPAPISDVHACEYDAEKAVAPISNPLIERSQAITLYDHCMELKGYQAVNN